VTHLELARNRDLDAREVAEGLDQRLVLRLGNDEQRRVLAPGMNEVGRCLRGRGVEHCRIQHGEGAALSMRREDAAERSATGLAVDLPVEAAHGRRECEAAAGPVRSARRAGAGAAGALLAPWLGAAAGDEAAAFCPARSCAGSVQLGLSVDDIDRFYDSGRAEGLVFTSPPTDMHGSRIARFRDVDGAEISVSSR